MKNLSAGRQIIVKTGNILVLAGIFFLITSIATAIATSHHGIHIDLSPLATIIIGLILKKGGYLAARRVAFLSGSKFMLFFCVSLIALASSFYQLPILQLFSFLFNFSTSLAIFFSTIHIFLAIWVYRQLTNETVTSEAAEASIPYQPFWRYSPARSLYLVGGLFLIVFFAVISFLPKFTDAITQIQSEVKTQYGQSAYVLIKGANIQSYNDVTYTYAYGTLYDGSKFVDKDFELCERNGVFHKLSDCGIS